MDEDRGMGDSGNAAAVRLADVEAVLFDLDGTLIDTLELIRASMRFATGEILGAPLADEVLMHNVGVPLIVQMREFDAARADELLLAYREHNERMHDVMVKEYPGVEATLEALIQKGLRLGVVTSKSRAAAIRGLERFSLGRFFDVVVTYDDVEKHKPDPCPLLFAAGQLELQPRQCAYVGDSPHDMSSAIAAGCVSVAALWGVASRGRLLEIGPDYVTASMAEVTELFGGAEARFRA